jgi:2-keto-4-pentenoate hydratase/2-oxohepta-3-ene-1,7-dioic acid hydratase in catechol pathway
MRVTTTARCGIGNATAARHPGQELPGHRRLVEVEIDGIGVLRNRVVAEAAE